MILEVRSSTSVGLRREHNEDAFCCLPDEGIFIVCDGMGGHASGEVASNLACEVLRDRLRADLPRLRAEMAGSHEDRKLAVERVRTAVAWSNEQVFAHAAAHDEHRGMGTTLTAMVVQGDRAIVGHVGDSRLYLVRLGQVHQVTTDHTILTEMLRAGRMRMEEVRRQKHLNALTRAIGVYEQVEVDTLELDLLPGDRYVLCSDGLHNYFDDFDLKTFLDHTSTVAVANDLVEYANRRGGADNITVISLRVVDGNETDHTARVRLALNTVRDLPLFRYLTFGELLRVVAVSEEIEAAPGEPLIVEGTAGDDLFIVISGSVRVHKGGAEIAVLAQGRHFGEMSLVDNRPRSASVTALEQSQLMRIRRESFYELLRQDPVMAVKLLWNFIQTLSGVIRTINDEPGLFVGRPSTETDHPYGSDENGR
jgi:serine/threonine protein phosphatase PrpC